MTQRMAASSEIDTSGSQSGRKVDFLCIGAQKAGTTWLNEQLLRHASVYLPPIKEVHYFNYLFLPKDRGWILSHYERPAIKRTLAALTDREHPRDWGAIVYYAHLVEALKAGHIDDSWYGDVYSLCKGSHRVWGDITPAYLALPPEGIRYVHHYNNSLLLLVLLREPVDRAISAAKMIFKRGKVSDPTDEMWRTVIAGHGILQKSRYAQQMRNWLSVFPERQILVLPYEKISTDAGGVMDEVCDFLAIARLVHDESLNERVHAGKAFEVPAWVRDWLEEKLSLERNLVIEMFPQFKEWWP
jgi:hypothetical protein